MCKKVYFIAERSMFNDITRPQRHIFEEEEDHRGCDLEPRNSLILFV
jgi:hypothetical protein